MKTRFAVLVIAIVSVILTLTMVAGAAWLGFNSQLSSLYPRVMTVSGFDFDSDLVFTVDSVGYEWAFCGTDDWEIGDMCVCIMDTNGTEDITDDSVLTARFSN